MTGDDVVETSENIGVGVGVEAFKSRDRVKWADENDILDDDDAASSSDSDWFERDKDENSLGLDVVRRLMTVKGDDENVERERVNESFARLATMQRRDVVAMERASAKKLRKRSRMTKVTRRSKARILSSETSRMELPESTVSSLTSTKESAKRIVSIRDDIEVVIHDVQTTGVYKSSHKKTFVQIEWKEKGNATRKVKTVRIEGTENPSWGAQGKFIFQNCCANRDGSKFVIKLTEVRRIKRQTVVGYAKIPSKLIPLDGTKLKLRIALVTKKRHRAKAVLSMTIGKATFDEPALGEDGYFPIVTGAERELVSLEEGFPSRREKLDLIVVNVMNARGVFDADGFGTSDVFVRLGFDTTPIEERYKTTIKYRTRYPEWNERFLLRVPSVDADKGEPKAIVFTLWDKDTFSPSDFLGAAAIPLDRVSTAGSVADLDMDLKARIVPDLAGEMCFIHPRAPTNLGKLRVKVSALIGDGAETIAKTVNLGRIDRTEGTSLARSVHVAVIAARQLAHVDTNGSCDAFAYVRMDNAPKNEFCRTDTVANTLHPVWNNGMGRTFSLIARPGSGDILFQLYDRKLLSKTLMGTAHVSLASLPPDGSWAQIATPVYGQDKNRNKLVGGSDSTMAWDAPERVKGELIVRLSATREPFANAPKPPPISEIDRYVVQHETNKYLYIQGMTYEGLPIRYGAKSTNMQIRMSLNTHKDIVCGSVQRGVISNFHFDPEVEVLPKTSLSRTLTIQVVSELTSVYGSQTFSKASRKVLHLMGLEKEKEDDLFPLNETNGDVNGDQSDDEDEGIQYAQGDEMFVKGNAIGYVQIPVEELRVGDLVRKKLKLKPMMTTKSWLSMKADQLGEIEVMIGCGYSKSAPKDLKLISQVARPTIGKFSFNIASVVGDRTPYQHFAPIIDSMLAMTNENEKFGRHVYATVMWDGREEDIKSSQERFNFSITEISGEIRVLFKCPDAISRGEQILGAISIPIVSVLKAQGNSIDAWFNITPPNPAFLTENEMADPSHAMCAYARSTKNPNDWQGFARIRLSFVPTRGSAQWEWYLKQSPMGLKTAHIPDTIDGVLLSLRHFVESVLLPAKMFARAAIFYSKPESRLLKLVWFAYHTTCCAVFQRKMVSTFILLWIVPGLFYTGFCSSIVASEIWSNMSAFEGDDDELETLRVEVNKMAKKRNKKIREFRDKILTKWRLNKLLSQGRDVTVSSEAVEEGMRRRKAKRARLGIDDELPVVTSMFLPRNMINYVIAVVTSSNPAEIVLRLIQKIVWKLLKVIKNAGVTLVRIDKVITSGGPRIMPGLCRSVGLQLETLADKFDRPIQLVSWGNTTLTIYFSLLTCALTFAFCCALFALQKFFAFIDHYSPLRIWHFIWLIGIAPTLPFLGKYMLQAAVALDTGMQLVVGLYVPVRPISLFTIKAIKQSLDIELKDNFKVLYETVKKDVNAEIVKREILRRKQQAEKLGASQRRFAKNGSNPIAWLASAIQRAPTQRNMMHEARMRALMFPGHARPPDVSIFRENVNVGRASVHALGKLLAFAIAVPIRALNAPMGAIKMSSEKRLDAYDTCKQLCALDWLRYNSKANLPFGHRKTVVTPIAAEDIERSPSGTRIVDVVDEGMTKSNVEPK